MPLSSGVGFLLWFEVIGFVLGLLFGSFLNVCIARIPRGKSVVRPGSRCMSCGHPIRWFDNVPVLSWLVLRGRCRDCGAGFSWRYPAVELAVGIWFWLAAIRMWDAWHPPARVLHSFIPFWTFQTAGFAILGFLLIGLIVIDWQILRLPDVFTLSGIAAGLFLVCLQAIFLEPGEDQITFVTKHLRLSSPGSFAARGNVFLTGPEALIFGRVAAICGAALIPLLIRWAYRAFRERDGMGLGDVKMLAMVAAFLGFWPAVLTLFFGVILASFYAIALLARRKATALTALPLGSFLGVAGLCVALFGNTIIDWYRSLL
jgi:leader peptidase (prepilin peptidase)/N-methyltransferase